MAPLEVVLVCHHFDLGGTEKSLLNHALAFDPARVAVRAVAREGPARRDGELAAAGIRLDHAHGDQARLAELLRGADVVHVGRHGAADPPVPLAAREAGVRALVATNVFGEVDGSPEEQVFACHLLVSQMCAMRHRALTGEDLAAWHRRHRVLPNPIDVGRLRALAPDVAEAKIRLGLDPATPVVGRLGRADDRKWSPLAIAMLPELARLVPGVRFLGVGMTDARRRQARRLGVLDRVIDVEPTPDERELAALYRACDVVATTSVIGESFGVVLAEAQALGIPVVTSSTPWTDNAQVEVVEHGVTGYLAAHPRAFAEAVAALLLDAGLRREFGDAGRARADERWAAGPLTDRLTGLYEQLVRDGRPGPVAWPEDRTQAEFEAAYPERAARQFRPLTARERLEARAAVLADRGAWLARDAAADPRAVLRRVAARLGR